MSVLSVIKPLAYLSLPVFALHTLSNVSPVARYYVRLGVYLSTLGIASMWGILVALGMNIVGETYNVNYVVARSFYNMVNRALGIKVVVEGEEHLDTRPAVLVGNHQSMLDIIYLGRIFPKRASIMAKKEVQWMPLLGWWMSLSGAVFVDRGNSAKAIRSLTAAGETIKSRHTSLWMFPEGTRSMREHHDMLPFKKGAFHVAVEAGIPIVPVVCENYWRLYRKGVFESGTIKVKVLPPVPTTGLTAADVTALSVRVREMMVEALREISVPVATASSAPSEKSPLPEAPSQMTAESQPQEKEPLSVLPSPASVTEAGPDATSPLSDSRSESRASTNVSEEFSAPSSRQEGSEAGVETEEDEGMVLVGRPGQ